MAKKPLHITAAGALTQRERIWALVRRLRKFNAADIESATGLPATTIRTYLEGLAAAGYIAGAGGGKRAAFGHFARKSWRLVRDCGIEAPAVTRDGRESLAGRSTLQMWRAMRSLPEWDYREIAHAASTERTPITWSQAKFYVSWLARVGYLRTVSPRVGHRLAVYTLTHHTGLKAPQIQRVKRVWDPNLGRVIDGEEAWK